MSKYTGTMGDRQIAVGEYRTIRTPLTDGDRGEMQLDANGFVVVSQGTALDAVNDKVQARPEKTSYLNLTASGLVRTGATTLVGMYVNSTSSGTIKFWDNTAGSGTVINNTITPAVGWHNLGNAGASTGVYATIGGTLDVTIYYIDNTTK